MKLNASDILDVVYDRFYDKATLPFTMDRNAYLSMTPAYKGDLFKQDNPFFIVLVDMDSSYRVGPTVVSPTRHTGTLRITYMTKSPNLFVDQKLLESVGNWFAEQTIEQVRFRTFTPYPVSKSNGFTAYDGVIHFDFELYRGG